MDDSFVRREANRPRRVSSDQVANVSSRHDKVVMVAPVRKSHPTAGRLSFAARRMERRSSAPQVVHQRHMPMEPNKFHIPRKTKEKKALFQFVPTESREYEDMKTVLTSSYIDTNSAVCFTYSNPRLVHSELLEKEFVEKRKEMKADGRTDKEMEESYCFLLTTSAQLPVLCEKGLTVGQSRITLLGDPRKGAYLSKYSDLLRSNPFTPGATGEIIIFKVMKGKVKSVSENMKIVQDPTPRFDSHIAKNASKVTSLTCYCAFELTQQYFYEYSFDELRQRPRQVCPYAVVSFHVKGKDAPLPSKPAAPIRLNSQPSERTNERMQFTVWSGELVKNGRVLVQVSLRSSSVPFLPHRLPEKLDVGYLIRLDRVAKLIPSGLLCYNLYSGSKEVVADGYNCSLLEVTDRNRSTINVTKLLQELEMKGVVLVSPLTERGFLFLLSSVQMCTLSERGDTWKRCLQALFVFPEPRDVSKFTSCYAFSPHESVKSGASVMPRLKEAIPALHQALTKARANPPSNLSASVELQTQEYLSGLKNGSVSPYPMTNYDPILDQEGKLCPPKHHRVSMDSYLQSYMSNPNHYLLPVPRVKQLVQAHCSPEQPQETTPRNNGRGQMEAAGSTSDGQRNNQKMQQLLDLVCTCKRNAEIEVRREEGEGLKAPERKRKLEQETAKRALKYFKASQETGKHDKIPVAGNKVPSSRFSFTSLIGSLGLKDVDLRNGGSELTDKFVLQLKGLIKTANQSEAQDGGLKESSPFGQLATKLGLPTNCDIDLRKQEELEEQTAASVSSSEGFSPSSHSGDTNHYSAPDRGGRSGWKEAANEEEEKDWDIPWVLIPITGLPSGRYFQRNRNIPQDPRFQHHTTATSITTTEPPKKSPASSPELSLPPSATQHSPPAPSPPPSPSHCPSPDPSLPSPSQCPSPDPSPPVSPSPCPSPDPSPPDSPAEYPSPETSPPKPTQCQSLERPEPNPFNTNHGGANKPQLASAVLKEFQGASDATEMKPQRRAIKKEEHSVPVSALVDQHHAPAPEQRSTPSPPPTDQVMEPEQVEVKAKSSETQPHEKKQIKKEPVVFKQIKREEEEMLIDSEQKRKGGMQELGGGAAFSPSVSSSTACPVRDIDSIVDKHLGDFASDIELLLQEESGNCSLPQISHALQTSRHQHMLPYASLSPFSHYVSFYNPCPPVQDYMSSLKDGISCMLRELDGSWPKHQADTSHNDPDETLAQSISDFVASFRAESSETGRNEEAFPVRAGPAAGVELSVSQASVFSRVGEVCQPEDTPWTPLSPHRSVSEPDSVFGSTYTPEDALEINRTITQSVTEAQENGTVRTVVCTAEGEESPAGANCIVTVPGYNHASNSQTEPSLSFEPVSSPSSALVQDTDSEPVPSTTDLSSVINQLNPDVLNNLVEIAKDIKRKSPQFYVHCAVPGDPVYEEVKEYLLNLGNVQQSPVDFLDNENSENVLLVIIKNKDTAGHIHKIPGLVSLKRHSSVVFVGIDSLDDIRNNSCIELFVSGGCIVSDELVLSPDIITHDGLSALLMLLEKNSSPESVWRWKVHCKTHKKLKEQARFRKDAANLLDVLLTYQKRQIVEFLPYHHCDMTNHPSPDLDCLIELQARYTQFRHTIYLTEHHFEKFPAFSSGGIIVASINDVLQNFSRLVGCHNVRDKQLLVEDLLAPKGLGEQGNHQDFVPGYSPSTFSENIHPISFSSQPQELLPQPSSTPSPQLHVSDQIVPDTADMEILQHAIQQLRAQRLEQLQQLRQQQQLLAVQLESSTGSGPHPAGTVTPPLVHEESTEQDTPNRTAVTTTLELIHSALQQPWEERREDGQLSPTEGGDPGGLRPCPQVRGDGLETGNGTLRNTDSSVLLSSQTAAAVMEPTSDGGEGEPDRPGEPESLAAAEDEVSTAEDGRSRDLQSNLEQPAVAKVTRIPVVPDRARDPAQHAQQPSSSPLLSHSQPPQRGVGLLHPQHMAPFHRQPFHPGPFLGQPRPLGGIRTFMGPTHLWPGGLTPTGGPLVWGYQQTGMDFLGGFYGPANPGGNMYRGARPGGGFNGM